MAKLAQTVFLWFDRNALEQQTWIQKLPFYIGILVSRSGEVQGHLQGGALGDSEGSRGALAAT